MNKFIELEDLTMHAKPFHVLSLIKGEKHQLKHANNNYILFVISGRLTLKDKRGNEQYLQPEHMYALCKLCAPFYIEVTEDLIGVVLLADSLLNIVDINNLFEILASNHRECAEVPYLPYNDVFKSYLQHILLLNDCKNIGPDVHDLKKVEYLHYMRKLYSKEELAKFIYGIVSTYSDFKMAVYKNYNNAINVEQLAESLFMTTKTFTRRFKQEFNSTPHKWILDQKIYNLTNFINNKGMILSEILNEFDFPSMSALRQFCKRNEVEHLLEMLPHTKMN